jgi:nucleoside-diphosphate-sugar epimerase
MKIALTGASGFVGGHLLEPLRAAGHEVAPLSRSGPLRFVLESDPPPLDGFDALIHAAYDFTATDNLNVAGSLRLFDAARRAGVPRLVFISSLSAFEGCSSNYGAMKLAVEKQVQRLGGCSVRLGFLCDDSHRGLSGSLKKLAALPVVPLPGGGRQNLFTIRAEDLAPAVLRIMEYATAETVSLAHPQPVSLRRMMEVFAGGRPRRPLFLSFPWRLLWLPLRTAEFAGLSLRFRSDSLVSLMNQNPAPDFTRLRDWNIRLQPF